jgi:glycerol-3-phosphate dehydrogenase subunit C
MDSMDRNSPETQIRKIVDACADCDDCRFLMDRSCFFLPELFRLHDREKDAGREIPAEDLRRLADLCNFCGLCPCRNVRTDIMKAKAAFIRRDGLDWRIRLLQDVKRVSRICGAYPGITRRIMQTRRLADIIKRGGGIHPDRDIPRFPDAPFSDPARLEQLNTGFSEPSRRKVAFFAGCTGRYLFPGVPEAAVAVLRRNRVEVLMPEQHCCGMPPMLEGDADLALKLAGFNLDRLDRVAADGYDIVCSCPTCGYMLKEVLSEGAYHSAAYQNSVARRPGFMKVPAPFGTAGSGEKGFVWLQTSIYGNILKDDGYFSALDPLKRVRVAEHTHDLGAYLRRISGAGELEKPTRPVGARAVYYAPCHLREQEIGTPYLDLLAGIPGLAVEPIGGAFDCCGIGGIMGFKTCFHDDSLRTGRPLMKKIADQHPDLIITDCLSCRLQFNQMISCEVSHPIEIIHRACADPAF